MAIPLSIDQVRESRTAFASLINQYCEQIHKKTGKARPLICIFMINEFKPYFPENWMRNQIDEKYKNVPRRTNGKLAWSKSVVKRLAVKAKKADQELKFALEGTI